MTLTFDLPWRGKLSVSHGNTKDGGQEQVQPARFITETILAQRGHMFGWVPVCLGIGIGGYFSLRFEPAFEIWIAIVFFIAFLCFLAWRSDAVGRPIFLALALVGAGLSLGKLRTESMQGPVLEFRYYGPIQGRVINIDRSASEAVRLTLDSVVLYNVAPNQTPTRVRVSIHGHQPIARIEPGDTMMMTGHLSPPSGPAEPGGFDFQRHAWFLKLGAVGYTRKPALRLMHPEQSADLAIFRIRTEMARALKERMPADTFGIAIAITTGDRSEIPSENLDNLRVSNLAHLLAISGLHMGLLTGFVFALLRIGLALVPRVALAFPTKKLSALGAITAGAAYLAISGGNVATQRAFIMVCVIFCAVMLDRRAFTLRAVAIAAILVLVLRPEALTGPGFQMSFAATTALVAVFAMLRDRQWGPKNKYMRWLFHMVMSSAIAGFATAPFAAAHFNQMAHYGLLANILSVPIMGFVVMPSAVLALCLTPIGGDQLGLWVMDLGLRWILNVAEVTASQPGAVSHVPAPSAIVLPLLCIGLLTWLLWQGRGRLLGAALVTASFGAWGMAERPDILIADTGGFIGVMTPEGRDLSRATGHGFIAGIWLENDGAPVTQDVAANRDGIDISGRRFATDLSGLRVLQVSGKTELETFSDCGGADILISNQLEVGDRPCLSFDQRKLRGLGALAISQTPNGIAITSSRHFAGERPWNKTGLQPELPTYYELTNENRQP